MRFINGIAVMLFALTDSGVTEDRIHFWVRAFIPNQIEGSPTYMLPVPGHTGQSMISSPSLLHSNIFFATDHRSFDSSPTASSRLATEFVLVIDGFNGRVENAGGKPFHRTSPTQRLVVEGNQVRSETKTAELKIAAMG
jgi:hypothetical protein